MHVIMDHVHANEKAVERALVISTLQSGKDLPDPYKDHPFHKGSIDEETPIAVPEQDISFEDEGEQTRAEPNPNTYKPYVPYPQALNCPRAKASETDDR